MRLFFTILFLLTCSCFTHAQIPDSAKVKDSVPVLTHQTQVTVVQKLDKLIGENKYLNTKSTPVALLEIPKKRIGGNTVFYILAGLFLFFGIIKSVFEKYFSTLFRVFFNSSLRQSQLTDQLMQSTVPALFFNILFICTAGFYTYLLLQKNFALSSGFSWWLLFGSVAAFIFIYSAKFIGIKLLSWVTGYSNEGNIYIFIVFLVNKIIGICLLPFIAVLAFSDRSLVKFVMPVSLVFIGILLLFRFLRSYGLLENRLKVNRFHFLLYIFSFEILPIIIIYKAITFFVLKNG